MVSKAFCTKIAPISKVGLLWSRKGAALKRNEAVDSHGGKGESAHAVAFWACGLGQAKIGAQAKMPSNPAFGSLLNYLTRRTMKYKRTKKQLGIRKGWGYLGAGTNIQSHRLLGEGEQE
jgi:hypothetical protein